MAIALARSDGLEDVIAAETVMSEVDGQRGRLIVRGYDVEELAGKVTFEQMCGLLWCGSLASPASLGRGRREAFEMLPAKAEADDAMAFLRACAARLAVPDGEPDTNARIAGAMATFAAAWLRLQQGLPPVKPDPGAGHAADYARMIFGQPQPDAAARALDAYLVTVADHGMNASTFTARVVASTAADSISSVVAAVCALKGPLHGGAPGPVLDMFDAIGRPEEAVAWMEGELAAGRRIMGMGHRVYRVRDPRAAVFERQIEHLETAGITSGRLPLARAIEQAAEGVLQRRYPDRGLHANVEFYTAVLLDTIGLPRELFTSTFAVARVAGWLAHVDEQRASGRLIRPSSRYVGPVPTEV